MSNIRVRGHFFGFVVSPGIEPGLPGLQPGALPSELRHHFLNISNNVWLADRESNSNVTY